MPEITPEELKEGKKQLGGVTILCWVCAIIIGIGIFMVPYNQLIPQTFEIGHWGSIGPIYFPGWSFRPDSGFIFLAVYVAELIGIHLRKPFAVPLGRAALVIAMVIFFPVGTIFGAILWKRLKHAEARKYLNYEG
jgi:hypothetical protein